MCRPAFMRALSTGSGPSLSSSVACGSKLNAHATSTSKPASAASLPRTPDEFLSGHRAELRSDENPRAALRSFFPFGVPSLRAGQFVGPRVYGGRRDPVGPCAPAGRRSSPDVRGPSRRIVQCLSTLGLRPVRWLTCACTTSTGATAPSRCAPGRTVEAPCCRCLASWQICQRTR